MTASGTIGRLLEGKEGAGATDPGLHLVEDQERPDAIAGGAGRDEVLVAQRMDASLAHDRLQQDGAGRIGHRLGELVDVVGRHVVEAGRQRGERGLVLRLPGRGKRAEGSTVERAGQGHELVRAALTAVPPRQLERRLVGLRARVGEEDAIERRARHERFGEVELGERVVEVRDLDERAGLARNGLGDGGMRMAQHVDGDPGHQVEVLAAGIIGHPAAVAAHQRQGLARVRLEVDTRLALRRLG